MKELIRVYEDRDGLRQFLASLILLGYHLVVSFFLGNDQTNIELCKVSTYLLFYVRENIKKPFFEIFERPLNLIFVLISNYYTFSKISSFCRISLQIHEKQNCDIGLTAPILDMFFVSVSSATFQFIAKYITFSLENLKSYGKIQFSKICGTNI